MLGRCATATELWRKQCFLAPAHTVPEPNSWPVAEASLGRKIIQAAFLSHCQCSVLISGDTETWKRQEGCVSSCQLSLWSGMCVCDETGHPVSDRRVQGMKSN